MAGTPKASVTKREPVAIATALVTVLATMVFVAPSVGLEIPDTAQKVIAVGLMILAGFGIRPAVTPVAAPKLGK